MRNCFYNDIVFLCFYIQSIRFDFKLFAFVDFIKHIWLRQEVEYDVRHCDLQ